MMASIITLLCFCPVLQATVTFNQKSDVLCGAECLYLILLSSNNESRSFKEFVKSLGDPQPSGYTLSDLHEHAKNSGAKVTKQTTSGLFDDRFKAGNIAIVHRKPDHFQILLSVRQESVIISDPLSQMPSAVSKSDFLDSYSDTCLVFGEFRQASLFTSLWFWACLITLTIGLLLLARRLRSRFLVAGLISMISFFGCNRVEPVPQVFVRDTSIDLGSVELAKSVQTTFDIQNQGSSPLHIEGLSTSCGCSDAKAEPNVIPAGGSGKVFVAVRPSLTGPKEVSVVVRTNDPMTPQVPLRLRWNLQGRVGFSIPFFRFALSRLHASEKIRFSAYHLPDGGKLILQGTTDGQNVSESNGVVEELESQDGTYQYSVKLVDPLAVTQEQMEGAIIAIDEKGKNLGEMRYRIQFTPELRVLPGLIRLSDSLELPTVKTFVIESTEILPIKAFDHKGTPLESQSQEIRSGVQSCKVTIPIGFEGEEIRLISGGNTVVVKVTR